MNFRSPSLLATKPAKCKICRAEFIKTRPVQKVCGAVCAGKFAVSTRLKNERKEAKRQAYLDRQKLQSLKSIPELKAKAQAAFNKFIRLRDADLPCICCGRTSKTNPLTGGLWDCGHYLSRGSADHLRFNEDNAHKQLKYCNQYGAGNAVYYRLGLIERIGLDRVEALESNHQVIKWNREMLIEIEAKYKLKAKELQRGAI